MRKLVQIFIVIVLSLTVLGSSKADTDGIFLYEYPKQSLLYQSLESSILTYAEWLFILPENDFDQDEAAAIINTIGHLPDSILKKAVRKNIRIKLFEGDLTDNPSASHLKGVIPRGYKTDKTWDDVPGIGGSKLVLVKIGSSEKGMGHSSVNLELHEFAHSLDSQVYDGIRNDPAFRKLWKKESHILFPGRPYFIDYPEEYFAETFALFYMGGVHAKLLKEATPRTYQYISQLK